MSPAAVREGVVLVPKQGPKSEEQSGARFRWREGDADEDEDADIWTPESSSSSPTVRNGNADNEDRKDGLRRDVDDPLITTRASPSPVLRGRDEREGAYWITLTVTQPTETYTTTVLLGDSYPSSFTTTPAPASSSSSLHAASIIGIVVGVIGGVAVLIGVGIMYVWLLRSRYVRGKGKGKGRGKRRRRRRGGSGSGSGSASGSGSGGGGEAVPGPPPEAVPAPGPAE